MRRLIILAALAAATLAPAAIAKAATVTCAGLGAGSGERCTYVRSVRSAQLWGTGKFVLGLPGGWEAASVYVSPGHWRAYVTSLWPVTGYVYARNPGNRAEWYWGGTARR